MTQTAQTILAQAIDAAFTVQGEVATYTPAGGDPVSITVLPRRPDAIEGLEGAQIHHSTALFDVRVAELAAPVAGDTLSYDGQSYTVKSPPRYRDDRRLMWTLETRPT